MIVDWIEVGVLSDIPPMGARVVRSANGDIAVFRTADDQVFALYDRCPHKGGPLSEGIVHGRSVTCPLHSWVISLETGEVDDALVTVRGDRYDLTYRLPGDARGYELFVESRGYYLEWMRQEWEADENLTLAMRMFRDPERALRALAPEFKRREASMEALFWGSRYAHP